MKETSQLWYIVQQEDATCAIVGFGENESPPPAKSNWGPFMIYQEAIAKRIGLIRSGKCQPQ